MKQNGRSFKSLELPVVIGGITFLLKAPPVGTRDRIGEALPKPLPPIEGFAKDAAGNVVRDEFGGALAKYNERDPNYLRAHALWDRRMTVSLLVSAARDSQIEWDATEEGFQKNGKLDAAAYADALIAEMAADGVGEGTLTILWQRMMLISRVTDEELAEARKLFTSRFRQAPTNEPSGNSPTAGQTPTSS